MSEFAQQWVKRFSLSNDDLVTMTELFPELEEHNPDLDLNWMCESVLAHDMILCGYEDALQIYTSTEEFAAARRLIEVMAEGDAVTLKELDTLHEAAVEELDPKLTVMVARVRELSMLSVSDTEISEIEQAVEKAQYWLRRGRIGKVRQTMVSVDQRISDHIKQTETNLLEHIRNLRSKATGLSYEQRVQVEGLLDISQERLRQRELRLAENACERARIVLEGGEWDTSTQQSTLKMVRRVDEFPLRAGDLAQLLENENLHSHPAVRNWEEFVQAWGIGQLRSAAGRGVRETISALLSAQQEVMLKSGSDSPWPRFLRKFFELLVNGPALSSFMQVKLNLGAHTTASSRFSAPGSFLDAKPDLTKTDPLIAVCKQPRQAVTFAQELATKTVLKGRLVIVFVSDIVPKQHRDDLRAAFKTHEALAVVIDEESILRILCSPDPQERTDRFVAILARQLPEATINPFRSDNAVSEGMFFGREKEIQDLLYSQESRAVFGGRKLGKTSLLKKIERVAEELDDKCVAIWLDIRNATSDEDVQRMILSELKNPRDSRKNWKEIFSTVDPSQPSRFIEQVTELLSDFPDYRFLFLLDEADDFMQRLATDSGNQNFGWALRKLCSAEPRVRFIFAGFQDVYRACRDALDGPWYNFIKLLELPVLADQEAELLVIRSLGLLGMHFQSPELVQRVLDYTSCHASLVQEFCHRLFETAANKVEPAVFGTITSSDVEAVFNDPDFKTHLDRIIQVNVSGESRTKRSLKLVLYAWVYRLVTPARAGDTSEMLSARGLYEFLEETFGAHLIERVITFDQMDSFLHDLLVLGVLGRSRDGQKYFLRNRHFARMLQVNRGSDRLRSDILRLLDQIGNETAERQRRLWARTADGFMRRFSPFGREDEQLWRTTSASTILILTGPSMGKTYALHWIEQQVSDNTGTAGKQTGQVRTCDLSKCATADQGLAELARAVGGPEATWDAIADRIRAWCEPANGSTCYLLVDNADCLSELDFLFGGEKGGLFAQVHELSIELGERFKLVLAGSAPLARVWVDWNDVLRGTVVGIPLRRLTVSEVGDWADGNRLSGELEDELQNLSGGHPYVLRKFYEFLRCAGKEYTVLPNDLRRFKSLMESDPLRSTLQANVESSDPTSMAVLTALRDVCSMLSVQVVDETIVIMAKERDQKRVQSKRLHWESEARVLALLDELIPVPGAPEVIGRLRPLYPWQKGGSA